MNKDASHFYVGIDLGTATVRCLATERTPRGEALSLLYKEQETDWFRGSTPDWRKFRQTLKILMDRLRKEGLRIASATVNVPHDTVCSAMLSEADNAEPTALQKSLSEPAPDTAILQDFRSRTGNRKAPILDPRTGSRNITVLCSEEFLGHLRHNLLRLGIVPEQLCATGTCLSYITGGMEKNAYSLAIDIGARFTDFAVFRGQTPVLVNSLVGGGKDITSALASGLNTPVKAARKLKEAGRIYFMSRETPSESRSKGAGSIIRREMEAILRILKNQTDRHGLDPSAFHQIVLCGGCARFKNIETFFKTRLGHETRTLSFEGDGLFRQHGFNCAHAAVIGLALHSFIIRNPS